MAVSFMIVFIPLAPQVEISFGFHMLENTTPNLS